MGDHDVLLNRRSYTTGLLVEVDLIGVTNKSRDTHLEGVDTGGVTNTLVVVHIRSTAGTTRHLWVTDNRYRWVLEDSVAESVKQCHLRSGVKEQSGATVGCISNDADAICNVVHHTQLRRWAGTYCTVFKLQPVDLGRLRWCLNHTDQS